MPLDSSIIPSPLRRPKTRLDYAALSSARITSSGWRGTAATQRQFSPARSSAHAWGRLAHWRCAFLCLRPTCSRALLRFSRLSWSWDSRKLLRLARVHFARRRSVEAKRRQLVHQSAGRPSAVRPSAFSSSLALPPTRCPSYTTYFSPLRFPSPTA